MSETYYGDAWDSGRVATQCEVSEKPTHSKLLGPDGKPLPYVKQQVGFRLNGQG